VSIIKLLKFEEGFRSKPYKCTAGRWSIGYGFTHGVTEFSQPITQEEAEKQLKGETAICVRDVMKGLSWACELDMVRRDVLVSMRYQLGMNGLLSFPKFLKAMRDGDWLSAANELRNSKLHKQCSNRVNRLIYMVIYGEYPEVISA
jgi:lysozyme